MADLKFWFSLWLYIEDTLPILVVQRLTLKNNLIDMNLWSIRILKRKNLVHES